MQMKVDNTFWKHFWFILVLVLFAPLSWSANADEEIMQDLEVLEHLELLDQMPDIPTENTSVQASTSSTSTQERLPYGSFPGKGKYNKPESNGAPKKKGITNEE
jgi:hypothetical protein